MTRTLCPKCRRLLAPAGEFIFPDGKKLPSFQCDECLVTVDMFGEPMELPLTFCLDERGQPFDPGAEDGVLRF
jgi:hypothetical protein